MNYLNESGFTMARLEAAGIVSPVVSVACNYKTPTTYDDEIEIEVNVEEYKGVKLVISYIMKNVKTQKVVLEGKTKHCFVNGEGKPIILKKSYNELDETLKKLLVKEE